MRGDQPIKNTEKQSVIAFTPHARGSTSKIKSSRPLSEIYPACAGINPQLWQGGRYLLHLPRMRGDQPTMIARRCQEKLFTPHARGSIQVNDRFIESTSIYPACAGINPMGMPLATPKKNLPRMRGDHPMQILGDGFVLKFTPHVRGSTQFDMPPARRASIYPACAGINPHLGQIVLICLYLPRMRGDQPGYTFVLDYWCEFPPRARGSTLVIALSADVVYIYPACAGISLGKAQLLSRYFNLPRRRGDQPRVTVMVASFSAFTPHARGSTMMLSQLKQRECQRLHKNSIGDIIPIYAE